MSDHGAPEVASTSPDLDEVCQDFGNIVRLGARGVVRPSDAAMVARVVEAARRDRIAIVPRGAGHSVFGQSQVRGGWVVDTGALNDVSIDGDVALVGAGARWEDVLRASLPLGKAPPVLTDYAGLSVAGTLSVGGFGGSSFRYGAQTDHVLGFRVVTGTGEVMECSAENNRALFDGVRAGMGQLGIIVQASLRVIAVPDHVRYHRIAYLDLEKMLIDLESLVCDGRFDQLSAVGAISPDGQWHFHIDALCHLSSGSGPRDADLLSGLSDGCVGISTAELGTLEYSLRLNLEIDAWRSSGLLQAPHPWVDVLIPGGALPAFADSVIRSLDPESLGVEGAMILVYPICAARTETPLLTMPSGCTHAYLFDVLRCTPQASPSRIEELIEENRRVYDEARMMGGSLYPISAVRMSATDWKQHFGSQWDAFCEAKQHFDPDGILGCRCGIFSGSG